MGFVLSVGALAVRDATVAAIGCVGAERFGWCRVERELG